MHGGTRLSGVLNITGASIDKGHGDTAGWSPLAAGARLDGRDYPALADWHQGWLRTPVAAAGSPGPADFPDVATKFGVGIV
jgi:hypothetical protein